MSNLPLINPKDGNSFYRLNTRIYHGNSPIRIQALVEYDTLENITTKSPLIKNNIFKVMKGTKWVDFMPFNNSFDFAISERVKIAFEASNITGVFYFPIILQNQPEKKYYCFGITSFAGKILNLERTNNFEDDHIEFDISTWDGSDVFTLEETGLKVCTKRVVDILTFNNFSNVEYKLL